MSEHGIGFLSLNPIKKGTRVVIENMTMKKDIKCNKVRGTVAWVTRWSGHYEMGMDFDFALDSHSDPELYDYFYRNVKKKCDSSKDGRM
jgi:hypothetical protein